MTVKSVLIVLGVLLVLRIVFFIGKCILGYVMCWGLRSFWEIVSEEFRDIIGF